MCLIRFITQAIASVNSGLLLMALMGLIFPAVLHYTHTEVHFGKSELSLSRFSSCIMLLAYAAYLFFQLTSQKSRYVSVNEVGSLILSFLFASSHLQKARQKVRSLYADIEHCKINQYNREKIMLL